MSSVTSLAYICVAAGVAYTFTIRPVDLAFTLGYSIYIWFLNEVRFDGNRLAIQKGIEASPKFFGKTPGFGAYAGIFALVTLAIPLIMVAVSPNEDDIVTAAMAPHLFVLLVQNAMEILAFNFRFHPLPRILIPLGFNTYRLQMLFSWVETALEHYERSPKDTWLHWGLTLAVLNAVLYTYNLFFFLIMRHLPSYMDPNQCLEPEVKWAGFVWPVLEKEKTA